jgi:ATP-dependent exoDNAse (exonuclease V) beta subunit
VSTHPDLLIEAPADARARETALDIRRSVIVQAPAGSGKTDLLTRRYLRLLAAVDEPEEILAITFTLAATAEMRSRILADLEAAAGRRDPRPEEADRIALAREALANSERRGWNILDHPDRLVVETIDSFCPRIAHDRPLLARLGGHLHPTEQAEPLYAAAARRTIEKLGGSDAALDEALNHLLDLRDNRLSQCESLIADMLKVRDHWQHAFPLSPTMTENDWQAGRAKLEAPFRRENHRVLAEAHRLLAAEPALEHQLLDLAHYAADQGFEDVALLAGVSALSPSMPPDHWRSVCSLLLTKDSNWRRDVNKGQGFPSSTREQKQRKSEMQDLLQRLQQIPGLLFALCAIRDLPPDVYTDGQWTTLRHIFTVLRQAIAELSVVFAENNKVDFIQLSIAALEVFKESPERILDLAGNIRHLLIDEFQDTSRHQHELVTELLSAWSDAADADESRTVFLVGDPMQSIYMFRQAEVELFTQVRERGLGCVPCLPVQLSVNFRSHVGLTEPINQMFAAICAGDAPRGAADVPFVEATASAPALPEKSVHVHAQLIGSADHRPTMPGTNHAQQQEALDVLRVLEQHLPHIERARATGAEYRVAILVRARTHLAQIVPLLQNREIPFRAVEIEHLSERQELLDLLALTRALLHPMNRIAWLSVLRAPWCGLTLADLHLLTGADNPVFKDFSVLELIDRHQHVLSADGQRRLARTIAILRRALDLRWRQSESPSFASWIERTWRTLGGPSTIDAAGYENAQVFFSLLDAVTPDGIAPSTAAFDAEFDRLFAQPDPSVSERTGVQLMTIHKAKGLGFDVVIVPGLDRPSSGDGNPLICSLERIDPWQRSGQGSGNPAEPEFLVAPLGPQEEETHQLYRWVRKQRQIRFDEERKRLLYVACTRARRELHLFGTAVVTSSGIREPDQNTLLDTAWPALQADFAAALAANRARVLAFPTTGILEEVAAVADSPARVAPRRLPLDAEPPTSPQNVTVTGSILSVDPDAPEFLRPEGSRQARLIGSAVHALLERIGPQLSGLTPAEIRASAAAVLRASALTGEALKSATDIVTKWLVACAADPVCRWILAPHPEAKSESSWTGFAGATAASESSRLRTLRADRVFRAGPEPLAPGSDHLWIVDYKTSGRTPSGALFLAAERALYAPQLQAYARAVRALYGSETPIRLGLYYPAITALDYWDPDWDPDPD